jgi:CubicO group peptidase (beta-lactamase class C family)
MPGKFILIVLGFVISVSNARAFSWDAAKQNQVLYLMQQYRLVRSAPLVAVSVTVNGSVMFVGAIDVAGNVVPGGENIRFRIGSVTKQFTAAGILAMIEDGDTVPFTGNKVTLNTALSDFFTGIDPWSIPSPMTVRRLLNMTSNIPNYTTDPLAGPIAANPIAAINMMNRIKAFPLSGLPGAFNYSNSNYFLLAQVTEVLKGANQPSGIPYFHNHIRDRIFTRAGMTTAGFVGEMTPAGVTDAQPHYLSPPAFNQPDWPKGAGDILSSVADMARWNISLMSGKVISQSSLDTMLTPAVPAPYGNMNCAYAMGWFVCDTPALHSYEHDGEVSGFRAYNAVARQGGASWMSVTALVNTDQATDVVFLGREIIKLLQ